MRDLDWSDVVADGERAGEADASIEVLIAGVKAYAREHYNDGGWDVIVECWDEASMLRVLVDEAGNSPKTVEEAVKAFEPYVSVYADQQADAENSAF